MVRVETESAPLRRSASIRAWAPAARAPGGRVATAVRNTITGRLPTRRTAVVSACGGAGTCRDAVNSSNPSDMTPP